jgi:hypothetical protein
MERAPKDVVEKDRARSEELTGKREKLARHLARVTSVEDGMEEKNPQHPAGGQAGHETQNNRSLDQMGTHGGPGSEPAPAEGQAPAKPPAGPPPATRPPPPAAKPMTAGPGQAVKEELETLAVKAVERVKTLARGLMEKMPVENEARPATPKAKAAPRSRPKKKAKPAAKSARSKSKGGAKKSKSKKKQARRPAKKSRGKKSGSKRRK